ncbi:hypothetical protein OE88DRAFT_1710557 [Heliocybe sulcata]|uniref:Uncharacterized protein n=1 Tax=Heliocybe sulcata TaxID=5364 RepID=A0A5C3NE42_9AGAM|nr:hypothetical protein OE88DRAFT_1710557 [Heliocybe sulcata]
MASEPPVVNVHTPTSSFAIVHSLSSDSLKNLFDTLSRKAHTDYHGERVGPGWVKYEWNGTAWNMDDGECPPCRSTQSANISLSTDSDYTIFKWRQKTASESSSDHTPTLHLNDPKRPLPAAPAYRNPSFYLFRANDEKAPPKRSPSKLAPRSVISGKSSRRKSQILDEDDAIPKHKKEFEKFHNENGVRTVMGSIGPVKDVRMLLKNGYRHVYISRKFALKHGFIPRDAAPGHYGYSGLVNIGKWPVTLGRTKTTHSVYLSEESHFDVVLGRAFMEMRQIKTDPTDPTDIVCLDTGEKIDCELVILKDGKGEIITVT